MLDAGRPANEAGVHLDRVRTIQLANPGRSFTRFPILFSIADRKSTLFAMKRKSPKPCANNVMMPSSNFIPSASNAWTGMNGWSGGHKDRFGSFLFWSCDSGREDVWEIFVSASYRNEIVMVNRRILWRGNVP